MIFVVFASVKVDWVDSKVCTLNLHFLNFQFFTCRVAEALILGTMMVGQATAFAPNYNKAVIAAARVFKLLDRTPLIDGDGQSGLRLVRHHFKFLTYNTSLMHG